MPSSLSAASLTEKKCGTCKQVKPVADFYRSRGGRCKECERTAQRARYGEGRSYLSRERSYEKSIQRLYGITLAEYEAMLAAQNGECAICAERPEDRLHVDHDHNTGAVRALLCGPCNTALGSAREDPQLLRAMITYLEHYKATPW